MPIKNIIIKRLDIPFHQPFCHHSAQRSRTQSLWVEVHDAHGCIGYGESCPREYVTDESLVTAKDFCLGYQQDFKESVKDLDSLRTWVRDHSGVIDNNPAAWCAMELAILDLLGKREERSIENLLGVSELSRVFQYTAVLGHSGFDKFKEQCDRYLSLGFQDFKIKLSGNLEEDDCKIRYLKKIKIPRHYLRADANNLWQTAQHAVDYIRLLDNPFYAIEEPLGVNDYEGLLNMANVLKVKIILDESFVNAKQFDHLQAEKDVWIINVRVSKMGGLLRSMAIIDQARELGVPVIVGAQVGETSLLTRAALPIVQYADHLCLAQEGAFGTHLLKYDIIDPPLMFGKKGIMDIKKYLNKDAGGFQITISQENFCF